MWSGFIKVTGAGAFLILLLLSSTSSVDTMPAVNDFELEAEAAIAKIVAKRDEERARVAKEKADAEEKAKADEKAQKAADEAKRPRTRPKPRQVKRAVASTPKGQQSKVSSSW